MGKAFKNIGFFLVTIMLTAVIFWLIFLDKESKGNVLDYSLNLVGDKLLAMVPEGEQKGSVKQMYDDFIKKAKAEQVAPEQVEYVAANIMNLSNLDTTLTPEQAEAVLKYSLEAPVKLERVNPESIRIAIDIKRVQAVEEDAISREQLENVGIRIRKLNELNEELRKAMKEKSEEMREKHLQLHYRIDDGLKMAIDPQFKIYLDKEKYRELSDKIRQLEREEMLEWREDFRKEMEKMREELKELEELKKFKGLEKLEALKALEGLKALNGLEFVPPVINADSIKAVVKRSLEEAKIHQHEQSYPVPEK